MFAATAALLIAVILAFLFLSGRRICRRPLPRFPTRHLEARKAAIYDNLRDLQFEYRVGKLSDADYQTTKTGLQAELAAILAEIDRMKGELPAAAAAAGWPPARRRSSAARPGLPALRG